VTKVKFTANDTLVVSTGGGDKTVMVWDTNLNEESVFDKEKRPVAQEVVN
jgi:WD40 repeat protein